MLQFDLIMQSLVYIPTVLLYALSILHEFSPFADGLKEAFIWGLLMQIPLGATQVLSGLVRSIRHGSPIRKKYLLLCVVYFAVLFAVASIAAADFILVGVLIIPPMIIASWYYWLTYRQLTGRFEEEGSPHLFPERDSLVLDELDEDERTLLEIQQRQRARSTNF